MFYQQLKKCYTKKTVKVHMYRWIVLYIWVKVKLNFVRPLFIWPLLDTFLEYVYKGKNRLWDCRGLQYFFFFYWLRHFIRIFMCLFHQSTLVWGSVCPFNVKFQVLIQFNKIWSIIPLFTCSFEPFSFLVPLSNFKIWELSYHFRKLF